ncbi:MAG: DUF1592 domain-containing protein [Myxococcales bacterium]|nr:DUF1592 domain-containing protein [Myxococcales bacterium]
MASPRRTAPLWRTAAAGALAALTACYDGAAAQGDAEGSTAASAAASESGESGSADAGSSDEGDALPPPPPFEPGDPVLPRLTQKQYRSTVLDLFGPGLPEPGLEADTNPYLFYSIGAATTTLSEAGTEQYEQAADAITRAVFDDPARRVALTGCEPTAPGDACVSGFLSTFGRRLYRRPLTADELTRWLAVAVDLAEGDAWRGVQLMIAGMLQSPHFLYRVELGEDDPQQPGRRVFTGWEMATRMAFLVWNRGPDEALLQAAEQGLLTTDEGLRAEAERLLADPRADEAMSDFFAQFLDLGRLDDVTRDPARYPLFTPTMVASMRTEIQLVIDDHVNRRDDDIRQIFSSRETFLNTDLAPLYGVAAEGATPVTFVPVTLPDDGPRAGILTSGAFLTMNAHETATSPTARGKYIRERVLCQPVPPPPDNVDTDLDDEMGEAKTTREKMELHRKDPTCAGCHAFIDPPGFLFENFDPIGAWRTLDNGYPVDASGDLDGKPLAGARDLADLLPGDPRVGECIVTQLYRHGNGRIDIPQERTGLRQIAAEFADNDYRFRELMVLMILSEAFRTVADVEVAP